MGTAFITPDQDAIISEIEINAPPERVFQALIDPKQVMQWWTSPGSTDRIVFFRASARRTLDLRHQAKLAEH
jgi:uncharacterized protein YndB with AHSA1/START domain